MPGEAFLSPRLPGPPALAGLPSGSPPSPSLGPLPAPVHTPINVTTLPPAPAASPPAALPPSVCAVRMLPVPAAAQPGPGPFSAGPQASPAISIVAAQALPLLVMAQRFMPGQQLLPAITTGARLTDPATTAPMSPRQGRQQAEQAAGPPAGRAPARLPCSRPHQRGSTLKRRCEEGSSPARGAEPLPSGLLSPAAPQRSQRARRANARAARGGAVAAAVGRRSRSPSAGVAPRRRLADSLFAAVAVVEQEDSAAIAAGIAGAAGALPSLPPLSIPLPAGAPAAELDLTPTATAVTTPLSPGRPAHRQRKGHARHAPDDAAPPAWEPVPGSLLLALAGASASEEEEAEAGAQDAEGEDRPKQPGHQAAPAATPPSPPPMHMVLRAKRQRCSQPAGGA